MSSFIHTLPPFFEKILIPPCPTFQTSSQSPLQSPQSPQSQPPQSPPPPPSILLLGAGGGYDIFGALYLYYLLKKTNQVY